MRTLAESNVFFFTLLVRMLPTSGVIHSSTISSAFFTFMNSQWYIFSSCTSHLNYRYYSYKNLYKILFSDNVINLFNLILLYSFEVTSTYFKFLLKILLFMHWQNKVEKWDYNAPSIARLGRMFLVNNTGYMQTLQ